MRKMMREMMRKTMRKMQWISLDQISTHSAKTPGCGLAPPPSADKFGRLPRPAEQPRPSPQQSPGPSSPNHGLGIRPHYRGELSAGPSCPGQGQRDRQGPRQRLQRRDPGCVQGHLEQSVGCTSGRLLGLGEETGRIMQMVEKVIGGHMC
jgi:hypothetical protein